MKRNSYFARKHTNGTTWHQVVDYADQRIHTTWHKVKRSYRLQNAYANGYGAYADAKEGDLVQIVKWNGEIIVCGIKRARDDGYFQSDSNAAVLDGDFASDDWYTIREVIVGPDTESGVRTVRYRLNIGWVYSRGDSVTYGIVGDKVQIAAEHNGGIAYVIGLWTADDEMHMLEDDGVF